MTAINKDRERALDLYLLNLPRKEIADDINVSRQTIANWEKTSKWIKAKRRKRAEQRAAQKILRAEELKQLPPPPRLPRPASPDTPPPTPQAQILPTFEETMYERLSGALEKTTTASLFCVKSTAQAAQFVLASRIAQIKNSSPEESYKFLLSHTKIFRQWMQILKNAVSIQKIIIPEGQEELFESLLDELSERNRQICESEQKEKTAK